MFNVNYVYASYRDFRPEVKVQYVGRDDSKIASIVEERQTEREREDG